MIIVIALLLSGANIYGYTKCNADAKNKASKNKRNVAVPWFRKWHDLLAKHPSLRPRALFDMYLLQRRIGGFTSLSLGTLAWVHPTILDDVSHSHSGLQYADS